MTDEVNDLNKEDEILPFKDYLKLNLIMWAFCIVVSGTAYILTDAGEVIGFLFGFLAVGFSAVSIYDWLFDKFVKEI